MKKKSSLRISMLLPRVLSLKTATVDKIFASIGLTHSAWVVLNCISRNPGKSTHALAELCFVTDQSFGQQVSKLAGQGLIERKRGFGKAILHELTDAGEKMLAAANPLLENTLHNLFAGLNEQEQDVLAELLERIMAQSDSTKQEEQHQAGVEQIEL